MKTNQAPNSGVKAGPSTLNVRCSLRDTILHAAPLMLVLPLLVLGNSALGAVRYVDLNSASPAPPCTAWGTAATNIQNAVDVAVAGDLILVTNGSYQTGARVVYGMSNRVAVTKPVAVLSVNGPAVTSIVGSGSIGATAVRCVYLTNGALLGGFTLTSGATQDSGDSCTNMSGGGVWCESPSAVVWNCLLTDNSAYDSGAGAYSGTLNNCTLRGNWADRGGGASSATLNGCVLTDNYAGSFGGGAATSTLNHCGLTNNVGGSGGGASESTLRNCALEGNAGDLGGGVWVGTLEGCTLMENAAWASGGGAYSCTLSNCTLARNSVFDYWSLGYSTGYGGGASLSSLNRCTLTDNFAGDGGGSDIGYGGGTAQSTLTNCIVTGNWGDVGGGCYSSTLTNCTVEGNSAGSGGGVRDSMLDHCAVTGNSASWSGGGASGGWLGNCIVSNNSAIQGGGVHSSILNNCAVSYNTASPDRGGGAYVSTLNNCTLTANSAATGGGAYQSTLNNCIVFYNTASRDANYSGSILDYSCTTPLPAAGTGNITAEPQFADSFHVAATSPCLGAGSPAYARGTDIDDDAWANPPAMGCDEFHPGTGTGPLSVSLSADFTNVAAGFEVTFTSWLLGRASANVWDFGDGIVVSNRPWGLAHSWPSPGDYIVTFRAYNDSYPTGVSASVAMHIGQGLHYVAVDSVNPVPPYTSWATAATNIQDAVDAASVGAVVWVTNGIYASGGRIASGTTTNRVAVEKALTLRSVDGPQFTIVQGQSTPATTNRNEGIRCVYLTNRASLIGFTLRNGAADFGGGVWSQNGTISNCVISGNCALSEGGGAEGGTLLNCVLTGNWARDGGGACYSTLSNCTLNGNAATNSGGGAYWCTLNDCTLTGNVATNSGGGARAGTLNRCALTNNVAIAYYGYGGGAHSAFLNDCTLTGNSARSGGGAYGGRLTNSTLISNSAAENGGGAAGGYDSSCTLTSCTLIGNTASSGGGAGECTLYNCTLTQNSAGTGGGAYDATLSQCTLTQNIASGDGGGGCNADFNNCAVTGNSAGHNGGGAAGGRLNNCTLTGNSASDSGGGANWSSLNNCILYYNRARTAENYSGTLNYCCTIPLPGTGTGNIEVEPQLASASRLSASSPCIGRGSATYASGGDVDGELWAKPPSIGCDEYRAGSITGALSATIVAFYTNVAVGFAVDFQAVINGRASASRWDFGDGVVVSNRPFASHAWTSPGEYMVELRAYNESYPGGVAASVTVQVAQDVHYVSLATTNPVPPYNSWATAANNIQDAVDSTSLPGALVLVTNGAYQAGGRAIYAVVNRLAVTRPVAVCSVNGPAVTSIVGSKDPATTNGPAAVRCVYLTNAAVLHGFTLMNGATQNSGDYYTNQSGGGVWCESPSAVVSNCVLTGNTAYYGGAAYNGTFIGCTLTGNSASFGGGAAYGTLSDCTLAANSASAGGGAYRCAITASRLSSNSAYEGGGAKFSTLEDCTLTGNFAYRGGGASGGSLNRSTLTANSAQYSGGGVAADYYEGCTVNACILRANSALQGGGTYGGALFNCTLTDNSARYSGGGAFGESYNYTCALNNSIVCCNTASTSSNYDGCALYFCCTTPLPAGGTGNIDAEPKLASASHLSAGSPCIGRGSAAYACGVDIDGEPWASPPSIGCDEYRSGSVKGALSAAIVVACTNVAVGFELDFDALIDGRLTASRWDFGDGVVVRNQPFASHAWATAGNYAVVLTAYNESYPGGVSTNVTVHVVNQPVHYVSLVAGHPVPPYDSWDTAATSIQDAVDGATVAGSMVLVSNGVYQTGGREVYGIVNRVAVTRPLIVRSVNGPAVTSIVGLGPNGPSAVRCVYLTNAALLEGFTLRNGATQTSGDPYTNQSGGGVWCESSSAVVSNCVLTGNTGYEYAGGAYFGTLDHCTLSSNQATREYSVAGAACLSTLNYCALSGNSAYQGGAVRYATLNYCTLTGHAATGQYGGGGAAQESTLNYCTLTSNSVSAPSSGGGGAYKSTLNHCTLTGNRASAGGGAQQSTLNYCTLTANSAAGQYSGGGGGASGGTLNNCILTGNSAVDQYGGGATHSALNNCTVAGNSSSYGGGGAASSTLRNCIVYYNSAPNNGNYYDSTLEYCWEGPPLFIATNGWSNLRLQTNSPCINQGANSYAVGTTDMDGRPRIVGGTVDIGAYEFQGAGMSEFIPWLQQYGLPSDGSADYLDSDGDGHNNWQEWRCLTDPTNALSALRLVSAVPDGTNVLVSWQSVAGVNYLLERSTNLADSPCFVPLATRVFGQPGTTSFTDTNSASLTPLFYRVGVGQ